MKTSNKITLIVVVVLGSLALSPIGFGLFIFISLELHNHKVFQEIPAFYREAGFEGEIISIKDELNGLSTEYPYVYQEKIDGKYVDINFKIGYLPEDIKPTDYDSPYELAQNYYDEMVSPFFEEAFENSQGFKEEYKRIEKNFSEVGITINDIHLQLPYGNDAANDEFTKQLSTDLNEAFGEGKTALKAIWTLDFADYIRIRPFGYRITINQNLDTFNSDKVDKTDLPRGTYYIQDSSGHQTLFDTSS